MKINFRKINLKKISPLKLALLFSLCFTCLGFRVYGHLWQVHRESPTLWIKLCDDMKNSSFSVNNMTNDDPLAILEPTWANLLTSYFTEVHSISTTFIRMASYPDDPDNPPTYSRLDDVFDKELAKKRTINVCWGSRNNVSYAKFVYNDQRQIIGCDVRLQSKLKNNFRQFFSVFHHELGHCLGLDHPQESVVSVMSYSRGENRIRYTQDDRMGITFLYPKYSAYGQESPTWGMACSVKN